MTPEDLRAWPVSDVYQRSSARYGRWRADRLHARQAPACKTRDRPAYVRVAHSRLLHLTTQHIGFENRDDACFNANTTGLLKLA